MMVNHQTISLHDYIVQGKGNIVSDMDGEKVMLSIDKGKYYNLGDVGGRIWELMEQPTQLSQMIGILMAEYEVEQSECERQVFAFIELLSKEGLVQRSQDNEIYK